MGEEKEERAERALERGDALTALKLTAHREDSLGLALRGAALAQLGELPRARHLLRRAERGLAASDPVQHARCVLASCEVELALRELSSDSAPLGSVREILECAGDHANSALATLLLARRALMHGRVAEARETLSQLPKALPNASLAARGALVDAEVAIRELRGSAADDSLRLAADAAKRAGLASLEREIERARCELKRPAARLCGPEGERPLSLAELETELQSARVVVDACRHRVLAPAGAAPLARRPVLWRLVWRLAEAWPRSVPRDELIACAFAVRTPNESHRSRLRVEIGRSRKALEGLASIETDGGGYRLASPLPVRRLLPPTDGPDASLLALLQDGESWSTRALALVLAWSERSVQRQLRELAQQGHVSSFRSGREQRWRAESPLGFATPLLLPVHTVTGSSKSESGGRNERLR